MPPNFDELKSHLNTPECEEFMKAVATCDSENKFKRYFGACDSYYESLNKCLLEQKELQRRRAKRPVAISTYYG